jgi:hypothetical protein
MQPASKDPRIPESPEPDERKKWSAPRLRKLSKTAWPESMADRAVEGASQQASEAPLFPARRHILQSSR